MTIKSVTRRAALCAVIIAMLFTTMPASAGGPYYGDA
jgi:hypothetical protein